MRARYSRQQGYSVSRPTRRATTIRPTQQKMTLGPTTAKYLGLTALAVLAMVMLSQANGSSTAGYTQAELRKEIGQVNQDIERLKLEAKRAQSVQEIEKSVVRKDLAQPKQVEYIEKGEVAGVSTTAPASTVTEPIDQP
jgi:hypothetical protein